MSKFGKYLYCFINETEVVSLGNSEIGKLNAPVYTIVYKDLAAVVSDAPIKEYETTRNDLLGHQHVISRVMERYAVVPVAFGSVASSKKDILGVLEGYYTDITDMLKYLKNRIELGLRITWENDFFNMDIETAEITKLKEKLIGRPEDEILKDKIHLGQLIEAAVLAKREKYIKDIFEPLGKLCVDSKLNDKIAVKTIFNAYFLVEKDKEAEFDAQVEAIAASYKGMINFMYTGPWPPYNFLSIHNISLS